MTAPTLAVGFVANPSSAILTGGAIRFFPYVYDSTAALQQWPYPITSWAWLFGNSVPTTFTTDGSGTNLIITTANLYFQAGDQVALTSTVSLPTGLSAYPTAIYYVKSVTSTAITISITQGGSAVTYSVGTGSGTFTAHPASSQPNPICYYRNFAAGTEWNTVVNITDSQGNTASLTRNNYVNLDIVANVPVPPNDGTYQAVSVLLYNATESALITRVPPNGTVLGFSNFYLMYPDIVNNLDKMGTATFSLLDTGNSTATDQSLNTTGTFVMIFSGQNLVFSGKIQTSSQSTQNGFSSTNAVILWNVTCESDYGKLLALNVPAAALDPNGYAIVDSPGDIARRILQPVAGIFGDWQGKICCEDIQIGFQLNSANNLQSAGDIYDKMETLRVQSTYDLRTRMDYLIFEYSTFTY